MFDLFIIILALIIFALLIRERILPFAMTIINGYGSPVCIFEYVGPGSSSSHPDITRTLPACNSDGEPESSKAEAIHHRTRYNGKITRWKRVAGGVRRKSWKLIYNQFITGADCLILKDIINYNDDPDNYLMKFIPYNDKSGRYFTAFISSTDLTVDILKGGIKANGMFLKTEIEITALELSYLDWEDATPAAALPAADIIDDPIEVSG